MSLLVAKNESITYFESNCDVFGNKVYQFNSHSSEHRKKRHKTATLLFHFLIEYHSKLIK